MTSIDPHQPRPPANDPGAEATPRARGGWRPGLAALLILGAAAGLTWPRWWPPARGARLLEQARAAQQAREFVQAERLAAAALAAAPELEEAALVAAESAAIDGRYEDALHYLERQAFQRPDLRVLAELDRAMWNLRGPRRITRAEEAYRAALRLDPDNLEAQEGLARLLALCGRRREAIPHVLRLIQQGVETDLLVLLARENSILSDRRALEEARRAAPDDPAPLLGLAWYAADEGDHEHAVRLLEEALALRPDHPAVLAALGRELWASGRLAELIAWERTLPPSAGELPDVWVLRGELAEHFQNVAGAIRCYWEAVRQAPELTHPTGRLAQLLATVGRSESAEPFAQRLRDLLALHTAYERLLLTSQHRTIEPALDVAQACERVGRLWEAVAWTRLAAGVDPAHRVAQERLTRLEREAARLPLQLTVDAANPARAIDLSQFPRPVFDDPQPSSPESASAPSPVRLSFREDAEAVGLQFTYFNGVEGSPTRRMYEFTGGGIGVLDFDRDAWPDLAFTQGRTWPPDRPDGREGDRLFRNVAGRRYVDVTDHVGIQEQDFGQGIAVGDFNADGFPDLFVANIGPDRLWRNNGDGTFSDVTAPAGLTGNEWTTSCLFADLDGDGLPDLYAVHYLAGRDVYERVCEHPQGGRIACLPIHFDAATDRLWQNAGAGTFTDATPTLLSAPPNGKGLGAAAWDADGSGRLSLLVANDTTPNLFYVPQEEAAGRRRLVERGMLSGLAVNAEGKAEGCMGIALGDVNDDGRLDVYITNFLQESNTLYVAVEDLAYEDQTRRLGLHEPTLNFLGFGAQCFDVDLDGRMELFVANGHVDDLRAYGRPYAMRPQLFRRDGSGFREVSAEGLGPYFLSEWLGRAAARLDWNRDGREDLVVGHLEAAAALLTNTTPECGAFVCLQLIGVETDRDATGTTVVLRAGGRTQTRQLTAGDSYHSCNQRLLTLGVGAAAAIEELTVRWPSGRVQRFVDVPLSRELILVEGRAWLTAAPR